MTPLFERLFKELLEEKSARCTKTTQKCWRGYKKTGTKVKGGRRVNNCVKIKS